MAGIMGTEELAHKQNDPAEQVWVTGDRNPARRRRCSVPSQLQAEPQLPPPFHKEVAMLHRSGLALLFALLGLLLVPALLAPAHASAAGLEGVPTFSNVFLIIGENTTYSQLTVGTAPYQESNLRPDAAWFTNYFATSHYSTSYYVAMTSGQYTRREQEDIKPIDRHQDTANIFNQLTDAGTS
jgi:hypothetical protein